MTHPTRSQQPTRMLCSISRHSPAHTYRPMKGDTATMANSASEGGQWITDHPHGSCCMVKPWSTTMHTGQTAMADQPPAQGPTNRVMAGAPAAPDWCCEAAINNQHSTTCTAPTQSQLLPFGHTGSARHQLDGATPAGTTHTGYTTALTSQNMVNTWSTKVGEAHREPRCLASTSSKQHTASGVHTL
jgi:hypothetical protein